MAYTFIHTCKNIDGVSKDGILLYPSDAGRFKSDQDKQDYANLFTNTAVPAPYAGAGKRFGPTTFSTEELRTAKLEHMKQYFSLPKDIETFWDADDVAHSKMMFPLVTPHTLVKHGESIRESAVRSVWQMTGVKLKPHELKEIGLFNGHNVFSVFVDLDTAKWEWMNHMAEKLTLTDWTVCPHASLLDELGIPRLIRESYCKTHGGPKFVTIMSDRVEDVTKQVAENLGVLNGVFE